MAATFEAAFATHAGEIRAHLLHSTRDPSVAEDLTQETFLRLCRELRAGRAPENTRAWLYRVSANLAASRGRRLDVARRWLDASVAEDDRADPPDSTALRRDRHARLEAALAELPPEVRVALVMAATGFSGREVARTLGRSEVATRTLLFRARLRLRARLREDEADLDASGANGRAAALLGRDGGPDPRRPSSFAPAGRAVPAPPPILRRVAPRTGDRIRDGREPVAAGALRSGHD